MTFSLPDDLAPECYPLAWLVGSWRGFGRLAYPGVEESPFVHDLVIDHDGGPYLRATSSIHLATGESHPEMTGREGAARLTAGQLWSAETQYWRPVPGPDGPQAPSGAPGDPDPTDLEVLVADPAGHVSVYVGAVRGPRIELATDAVVRTASAAELTGATRMYGLVEQDLMWAQDLAAFGQELQTYASGRLSRIEE